MSNKHRNFRDDINGLRAWAVLAVIFYHFGVYGFTGGFIGVDIFFVISGFLMTGIVIESLENQKGKKFSVMAFYMARARRILPALIVLCAVLLAIGWFALPSPEYKLLGSHSAGGISFISNIQFWREAGYFDAESHDKWLLHTWSLAVEWQFYIILPLILASVWHYRPNKTFIITTLTIGLIASLATSIILTPLKPTAAFYLLPTRAWEMLAGGLGWLLINNYKLSKFSRVTSETSGFILIIGSIVFFDTSTSWPGWRALAPVSGTLLIIFASRSNSLWTCSAFAQWLGTRSYSLYLWHWPIVVALNYFGVLNNTTAIAAGLALTLVLGNISYNFVETPTRRYLSKLSFRNSASVLASFTIAVIAIGLCVRLNQGYNNRLPSDVEKISLESKNQNPRRDECLLMSGVVSPSCMLGGSKLQAVVLGDSHADAIISAVVSAAPKPDSGIMELTYSSCPIIKGVHSTTRKQCGDFVDWAIEKLKNIPEDIPVIIVNRHAQYAIGRNNNINEANIPQVYFSAPYKTSQPEYLEEYAKNLISTSCEIAKNHVVYLVRPIPEMDVNVPTYMARTTLLKKHNEIYISLDSYNKRQDFIWKAQNAAREQCGVKILNPLPYLCSDQRCFGEKNNRPLYRDSDHLSEYGNKFLVPMFSEVFQHTKKL